MAGCRLENLRHSILVLLLVIGWNATSAPSSIGAEARPIPAEIAARLTDRQQQAYAAHLEAQAAFDRALDIYWGTVEELRDDRKKKRAVGQAYVASDYVLEQPPIYLGPPMPADVARIIASLTPPEPPKSMPGVADFLAMAKAQFNYEPTLVPEAHFKRRYAEEALSLGLTKDQVVRVYALETGGRGTYDMQAGIDPESKKGRPISSAIGYAQLLGANSTSELVRHGEAFIQRLDTLARTPGTPPTRMTELRQKILALRRMLRVARSVANEWRSHLAFANTPNGLGIHAVNLDGDIGPWLQVLKLKGLLQYAARENKDRLTGAELELMNLAGPRTGLEMMEPIGRTMPTTNFFSRGGYYRNTIVRGKTGAELLAALEERMGQNLVKKGSIEFGAAFDEAMRRRSAGASHIP